MTIYIRFTFPRTLVYPNNFRLGLFGAFFEAWFSQNNFLTELKSPTSAVHFSFGTLFQYLNFVRFCSYSKHKLSHQCSLQWCKLFLDIFFIFDKHGSKHWGPFKKSSIFEQREHKYANTWTDGGRAGGQKSLQNHFYCFSFVYITICFHSAFTFLRF